jgi:cobalt-zinc-cadmium efflux system outer membrane protein
MNRPWRPVLRVTLLFGIVGCTHVTPRQESAQVDERVERASHRAEGPVAHQPMTVALEPSLPPELNGPQPVEVYIRRALAENRTVQAAFHNVQSLRYRIPQVTTLDDPVASNTVFPIPSVAPQYSLMGYNPYNITLAQQFPWFGTLRLRGQVAEKDVQVALAELAAAQLDAIAAVKRAYYDLYASQKTEAILIESRGILEDFQVLARQRVTTGGSQQDVLRADVLLSELDRSLAETRQGIVSARAVLARQIHVSPETDLRTLPTLALAPVPAEIHRLYELAITVRPELRGRLAAVARDEKAVALALKRFYPNLTLGLTYMDMEKTNAVTPKTAAGFPNVGLFVAFNLPVYRDKYRAGVCEAKERALADAKLYEAQRDETQSEIKDLMVQAQVQQNVLTLLRDQILPRTRKTLDLVKSDYSQGNIDIATLLSAMREVLQIQLQITQVEAELGKALASLERAVGGQINEHPPHPVPAESGTTPTTPSASFAPAI